MFKHRLSHQGFTLVELSIVLVVIGLLIGGILVGQSLISSAKINAQVKQLQQFDIATAQFKSRYKYLPGDAPAFGGDGDRVIDRGAAAVDSINVYQCELENFWPSVFPSKFTRKTCSEADQSVVPGINVPKSQIGIENAHVVASGLSAGISGFPQTVDIANPRNYFIILSPHNYQIVSASNTTFKFADDGKEALTPVDLLALDEKLDDGLANSGGVISGRISHSNGGFFTSPKPRCSSGANYIITNVGYECTPLIRIGSQTGNPL